MDLGYLLRTVFNYSFFELSRYFLIHEDGNVLEEQRGVIRSNCIDCLDRTNVTQVWNLTDLLLTLVLLGVFTCNVSSWPLDPKFLAISFSSALTFFEQFFQSYLARISFDSQLQRIGIFSPEDSVTKFTEEYDKFKISKCFQHILLCWFYLL